MAACCSIALNFFRITCPNSGITAPPPCVPPENLGVWYQKYLDQQNPVKVQQISDQEKMKQMEREIKELKRANEILRKAAAFFA